MTEHGVSLTCDGLESLLNVDDEDGVVKKFSFEKRVHSTAGIEALQSSDPVKEVPQDYESLSIVKEELNGLAVVSAALERLEYFKSDVQAVLRTCQRELRAQKLANMNQTVITDQFKLI